MGNSVISSLYPRTSSSPTGRVSGERRRSHGIPATWTIFEPWQTTRKHLAYLCHPPSIGTISQDENSGSLSWARRLKHCLHSVCAAPLTQSRLYYAHLVWANFGCWCSWWKQKQKYLQQNGAPLWIWHPSHFQQGGPNLCHRLQKQLKILFHLSLTSNEGNEKADHDDTLMNSESLDPRSLSMACLVERLQPRGPGVKSFLSGEVACHYHNLSLAVAFSAIFSCCMRMSSF